MHSGFKIAARHVARLALVALAGAFGHDNAFAGNWSSGGGEILEHAQNPWFIDHPGQAQEIPYCVVSGNDFPIRTETLELIVKDSLLWWDRQFSNAHLPENKAYFDSRPDRQVTLKIPINTSGFKQVPCEQNPELAFQFGYLTEEQRREFEKMNVDLRRYVALTIRTDYSDMLRGRGFIYISPDRGDHAFRGANVLNSAWTHYDDPLFYRIRTVLAHELGHVFGLSHAAQNDSIMSARLAELTVSKPTGTPGLHTSWHTLNNAAVFFPKLSSGSDLSRQVCDAAGAASKAFRSFFDIPEEKVCFRLYLSLGSLRILVAHDKDSPWEVLGEAKFIDGGRRRHSQLISLWLPATQKLFPGISSFMSALLGPASSEIEQKGTFVDNRTGIRREIFMQASPRYLQIGGIHNNQLITDLLPVLPFGQSISGWTDE